MARKLEDVIDQILALLPNPGPPELLNNISVLRAELAILRRTSAYVPPEALNDSAVWQQLATVLYRYLPNPAGYPWAQQISSVVLTV